MPMPPRFSEVMYLTLESLGRAKGKGYKMLPRCARAPPVCVRIILTSLTHVSPA